MAPGILTLTPRLISFPIFAILLVFNLSFSGCGTGTPGTTGGIASFPKRILWAWERPENLEFLDSAKYGVAFLAQTLALSRTEVNVSPRRQPLKVNPSTKLIAVTRIETEKRSDGKPALSDEQSDKCSELIAKTAKLKNVSAVQIDFDATVSERGFYVKLISGLRQRLPAEISISITALASFCMSDDWIRSLSVDEIVPMIFRMGADERTVKDYLANAGDFKVPGCRMSYGISVDEPVKTSFPDSRRVYFFNVRSWSREDVEALK